MVAYLSTEVAARLADEFPDGVWFFELAAVADLYISTRSAPSRSAPSQQTLRASCSGR
jgi:hypothetical protein